MKPSIFRYHDVETREELVALLAEYGDEARVLAGGQSLMPMLNLRIVNTANLIDINGIDEFKRIEQEEGTLFIGALVRHGEVETASLVTERCTVISQAIRYVGHPAIRERGTVLGSVAHADPAAELPAVTLVLEAELMAESRGGVRIIPAADFFVGPLSTTLSAEEALVGLRCRLPSSNARSSVLEISRRHGDFAVAGIVCQVEEDSEGHLEDVRIAGFGVGPLPTRLSGTEALLRGEKPTERLISSAVREARGEVPGTEDTHASAEYRRYITGVLVGRSLQRLAGVGSAKLRRSE